MGVTIGWDETKPADTDVIDNYSAVSSLMTNLRGALNAEHNFPSGGGDNVGVHVLGAAKTFYGVQSTVSSSGTDGRLMIASDTSRLFGVGSGGTAYLGGVGMVSAGSFPGGAAPQRSYWAVEIGSASVATDGSSNYSVNITFPNSGYSGVPMVFLGNTSGMSFFEVINPVIKSLSATSMNVQMTISTSSAGAQGPYSFNWLSLGTRTL